MPCHEITLAWLPIPFTNSDTRKNRKDNLQSSHRAERLTFLTPPPGVCLTLSIVPHLLFTPDRSCFTCVIFTCKYKQAKTSTCRVRKGTGSQSVVVCVGKYPRGKYPKAVGYARSYWQSGVLCTPGLAVLRVCVYRFQGAAKPCLYWSNITKQEQLSALSTCAIFVCSTKSGGGRSCVCDDNKDFSKTPLCCKTVRPKNRGFQCVEHGMATNLTRPHLLGHKWNEALCCLGQDRGRGDLSC